MLLPNEQILDRDAWLVARSGYIGASEVAALFAPEIGANMPDYMPSLYTLWHHKRGAIVNDFKPNERSYWGLRLEDAIVGGAVETDAIKGTIYRRAGWFTHPVVEGLAASPDFLAVDDDGKPTAILETKNADWLVHKRQWGNEPPEHILLQVQTQLACTGLDCAYVCALIGGNHVEVYPIERRQPLIDEIERRVAAFWQSIRNGREPKVDGSNSTARTVAALYPDADEPPIDLTHDNELPSLCATMLNAAAEKKAAEKREQAAKSAILAKVGNHAAAWCTGFSLSVPAVAPIPDKTITAEMVGEVIKGRAGYRKLTIREQTK